VTELNTPDEVDLEHDPEKGGSFDETADFVEKLGEATPKMYVTPILILCNVAVFAAMVLTGVGIMEESLLEALGKAGAKVNAAAQHVSFPPELVEERLASIQADVRGGEVFPVLNGVVSSNTDGAIGAKFGGNVLAHDHTLEHFREAFLLTDLFDRPGGSGQEMLTRAHDRWRDILSSTEPYSLPDDKAREIDRIVERAEAYFL